MFDTQTFTVQNYVCLAGIFNKMTVCRPVFGMYSTVPKGRISHSAIRTAAHLLVRHSYSCYQFTAPKVATPYVECREENQQFWLRSFAVSSSPLSQWQPTEFCWRSLMHFQCSAQIWKLKTLKLLLKNAAEITQCAVPEIFPCFFLSCKANARV